MSSAALPTPRPDIAHQVSPGLWALAWQRLRSDYVGMVSLLIVAAFLIMMVLSATGLVAKDWAREVGVNYAPPSFAGASSAPDVFSPSAPAGNVPSAPGRGEEFHSSVVDPLADDLAALRGGIPKGSAPGSTGGDESKVVDPLADTQNAQQAPAANDRTVDPLADVMADIHSKQGTVTAPAAETRAATLPLGADKWGRDVLKKTIKGSETSIFVGLASALLATCIGTLMGAFAGYFGGWVDDFFNWLYSVFSSIPYLLLILAVAAVLQQKGTMTIILILGLTGWSGVFRLIRGEYLKHKSREYVQAADAIGASNPRRMFVHILPNVSHVVLVQLSILVVAFIKSEVILSFLGFGVPVDVVSWGSMLNEAQNELILGKWWQLAGAGTAMAVLVTAFSLFTDALRDALDPKLRGRAGL
ncbi:MAG: ABC transporter permease [Pseudomonadota bacterium]|nr:ABC transporter permease [Pseudomonadota bacterium]